MKVKLQKPELIILLKEKLSELEKLCSVFDSGNADVITNMAKVISRIFQNTETSKSLLNQLKLIEYGLCLVQNGCKSLR